MTISYSLSQWHQESAATFPVHFSNPSLWAKWAPDPDTHWKLLGPGEVVFKRDSDSVVLRGLRRRPDGSTVKQSAEIAMGDVLNVTRQGRIVRFFVRLPLSAEMPMQFWAADEASAHEIVRLLPNEYTAQFVSQQEEQEAFTQALDSIQTQCYVTPVLLLVNCLTFLGALLVDAGVLNPHYFAGLGSSFITRPTGGEWWRLMCAMFLSYGPLQLLFNIWALWSLGRMTERLLGSVYYLLTYVLAGLCGSVASLLWHHYFTSAGASAAVCGVLGLLIVFVLKPPMKIPSGVIASLRLNAMVFVVYTLASSLQRTGVDMVANIAGICSGFAVGALLSHKLERQFSL